MTETDAPVTPRTGSRFVRGLLVGGIVGAVAAGIAGYQYGVDHEDNRLRASVVKAFGGLASFGATPTASAAPTATVAPPAVADVSLDVSTVSKQCFGDTGCNLEVKILFNARDLAALKGSDFDVTYQMVGTTDGGTVGTFEVRGGRFNAPQEAVQVAKTSDVVTARVTAITAR